MSLRSFRSSLAGFRAERLAAANPPLVVGGRYDRAAIMREAVKVARSLRAGGKAWTWRMAIGLRHVWGRAKAEMAEAARPRPHFPVRPALALVPTSPRPRVFHRGSRAFTHGW